MTDRKYLSKAFSWDSVRSWIRRVYYSDHRDSGDPRVYSHSPNPRSETGFALAENDPPGGLVRVNSDPYLRKSFKGMPLLDVLRCRPAPPIRSS